MLNRENLELRAAFFRYVREFFETQGFIEVDTPLRQQVIIPEAHIHPLMSEGCFLQTSPELFMKRLLAAGCDNIFQICRCFRKDERGRNHLEEFTMLEWYRLDAGLDSLMADCESLLRFVLSRLVAFYGDRGQPVPRSLVRLGDCVNRRWIRLTVAEAFADFSPVLLDKALEEQLFEEILVEYIEPELGREAPFFLYEYPLALASLARQSKKNPNVAERFEVYIDGLELANGFAELTDPEEQRQRFGEELKMLHAQGYTQYTMPEQFLKDLEKIDEAAGIAFGLDRLLMLCLGAERLQQIVPFS